MAYPLSIDTQTNSEVNQTQISHSIPTNTPKYHQNGHISKPHFAQVSFTKKPTPTPFDESVRNSQNQCKHRPCTHQLWPISDSGLQKIF